MSGPLVVISDRQLKAAGATTPEEARASFEVLMAQMQADDPTADFLHLKLEIWDDDKVKLSPYPTATLTTGATIRFRSADKPDTLRGPNLSGVWLDEGSLMDKDVFPIVIGCLREGGEQGWLSATFTPKGTSHWTYERFATGQPDTELFHCHTKDNPFLPPAFAATLAKQYFGAWAQQELGGLFVSMEGAEWPAEFFEGILFDEWPADFDRYLRVMALDPSKGKNDASGDFSAWIMLGVEQDSMTLWVDADLDARRPVEPLASMPGMRSIVTDGIELFKQFRPSGVLVETNGFQSMCADALMRISRELNIPMPIFTISHSDPKAQRIRTIGPILGQRRLRIRNTPGGKLLLGQLRDFRGDQKPSAGIHDDGPDALATAIEMANFLINGGEDSAVQILTA